MSPEQKCAALRLLAKKRRRDNNLEGYCRLSDFHGGYYECCFVSPWSKSAHNTDADVVLLGQDWSSSNGLNRPRDPQMRKLGHTWNLPTNVNLPALLRENMQLEFRETYATNVFPFIKNGPMDARIGHMEMQYCAREYAVPQIEIISPKMVICLGKRTFEAIRQSLNQGPKDFAEACQPKYCINHSGTEIYGAPHPGSLGVRNAGGIAQVHERWRILGNRLIELRGRRPD